MNFGLGYSEIAIIMIFALIVVGPKKLPKLMRDVGRLLGQLRRTSDELRREILFSDEIKDFRQTIRDAVDPLPAAPAPPRLKLKTPAAPPPVAAPVADGSDLPAAPDQPPSPPVAPGDGPHDG